MSYITVYFPDGSHKTIWLARGATSFEYAWYEMGKAFPRTPSGTRATIVLADNFKEKMIQVGRTWLREKTRLEVEG